MLLVLTGEDVKADDLGPMPNMFPVKSMDGTERHETYRPLLAQDKLRHVGEPVAMVVAETLAQARDAAEMIVIDYDELPAATDTYRSALDGAAQLYDHVPNNICFDWGKGQQDETESAFAKASHVTTLELVNNRVVVNSMEPRAAIGDYDSESDKSTLYTSSQGTHGIRNTIADAILKIDQDKLRVVTGDVGGGFGMKIFTHPEQPMVVWAAKKVNRPVRWNADRSEGFMSDIQGRDHVTKAEVACDDNGKFLALRVTTYANLRAYLSHFGTFIPTEAGTAMLNGLYAFLCLGERQGRADQHRADRCLSRRGPTRRSTVSSGWSTNAPASWACRPTNCADATSFSPPSFPTKPPSVRPMTAAISPRSWKRA